MAQNEVVIVSGGAHGIGEAAVLAFAREGYRVALSEWGRKHPLGRIARPGEIAEVVVFLASDKASFAATIRAFTVPGERDARSGRTRGSGTT